MNPVTLAVLVSLAALCSELPSHAAEADGQLVGNVYGSVLDDSTSQPIAGAAVLLFDPLREVRSGRREAGSENRIGLIGPIGLIVLSAETNDHGDFLINFVPTSLPCTTYTIVVRAAGYNLLVIERARVLPGAVMALEVNCRLRKGGENEAVVLDGVSPDAPLSYRHEQRLKAEGERHKDEVQGPKSKVQSLKSCLVYATREGLVGATTANGHIIQARDRFVALPSRRALNVTDQNRDFVVELNFGDRVTTAPVWDIGPWNTKDDYWNPSAIREMWYDLAEGIPQAQAAYQNGYNAGFDEFGRRVLNPAGIDLADGTFWDDLGLADNEWVTVRFLWRPGVGLGQRVRAIAALNVRATPAGTRIGVEQGDGTGTIIAGPEGAFYSGVFYVWWKISWDDGLEGWSVEKWLAVLSTQPTSATRWHLYR